MKHLSIAAVVIVAILASVFSPEFRSMMSDLGGGILVAVILAIMFIFG